MQELAGYVAHSKTLEYDLIVLVPPSQSFEIFRSILKPFDRVLFVDIAIIASHVREFYASMLPFLDEKSRSQLLQMISAGKKIGHAIDISAHKAQLEHFLEEVSVDTREFFWPWMDLPRLPIYLTQLVHPAFRLNATNAEKLALPELFALSQESGISISQDRIHKVIANSPYAERIFPAFNTLASMSGHAVINIRDVVIPNSINNCRNNCLLTVKNAIDAIEVSGINEIVLTGPTPSQGFGNELMAHISSKPQLKAFAMFTNEFIFSNNQASSLSAFTNLLLEPLAHCRASLAIGPSSGGVALPLVMKKPTIMLDSIHLMSQMPYSINIAKTFPANMCIASHADAVEMLSTCPTQLIPQGACTAESTFAAVDIVQTWISDKLMPYAKIRVNSMLVPKLEGLNHYPHHRYILTSYSDKLFLNHAIHMDYDGSSYRLA